MKTAKTGRRRKDFIHPETGLPVVGLTRRPDGRWRIIGTHKTFREADPIKAIQKFNDLTDPPEAQRIEREIDELNQLRKGLRKSYTENDFWERVLKEITDRPRFAAKRTGIEWIGYGPTIQKPKPLPTFDELEQVFKDYFRKSPENKRKVLAAWEDFKRQTGVQGLKDITPEVVVGYRDKIYEQRTTGKSQANIFGRIRRLFTFAKSRAIAIDQLAIVLNALSLLIPSDTQVSLDPKPIEVADWKRLLGAATGEVKAQILLQLNVAMYCTEVIRLKWSDIRDNGTIVTHRAKEGKCVRAAVLWKETLDALAELPRKGEYIFYAWSGAPLGVKGAELRFRTLREKAKVEHVTSSMLRDGAATAAAERNVTERLIAVMLGHRSGISDHYIKRNPQMVKPATDAVHAAYFGAN